jgi:hypothetical protein
MLSRAPTRTSLLRLPESTRTCRMRRLWLAQLSRRPLLAARSHLCNVPTEQEAVRCDILPMRQGPVGERRSTYSQLQEPEQSLPADRDKMFATVRVVTVALLLACCRDISGQSLGLGKCPSYPAVNKLDLKKVGIRELVYYSCM